MENVELLQSVRSDLVEGLTNIDKQLAEVKNFIKERALAQARGNGNTVAFVDQLDFSTKYILEAFDCEIARLLDKITPELQRVDCASELNAR